MIQKFGTKFFMCSFSKKKKKKKKEKKKVFYLLLLLLLLRDKTYSYAKHDKIYHMLDIYIFFTLRIQCRYIIYTLWKKIYSDEISIDKLHTSTVGISVCFKYFYLFFMSLILVWSKLSFVFIRHSSPLMIS